MSRSFGRRAALAAFAIVLVAFIPAVARSDTVTTLVGGTAVLLSQTSGNGGNTSSTSSNTTIFSPAAYVDYKRRGGEPAVIVDRYPFSSQFPFLQPVPCAAGKTPPCFQPSSSFQERDLDYACAPEGFGFPHFSYFWKSDDLGQTFRVPQHLPIFGENIANGGGGGDCHMAVGQVTHKVFFVDLPGPGCVTVNTSTDLGENFTPDDLGCGASPGAIDDRQWIEADESGISATDTCLTATPLPTCGNVYVTFVHIPSGGINASVDLARSTHDGAAGTFVSDSVCNLVNDSLPPAQQSDPTLCPDPDDPNLVRAGPIVADKSPSSSFQHSLYIPFIRSADGGFTPPYSLWVAISRDQGKTWRRFQIAQLGPHNPSYDFPDLTIDTAGNLYVGWVQDAQSSTNETDAYYAFSTPSTITLPDGTKLTGPGLTWSSPINLTGEANDSAVFPWLVAGSPGDVDYVIYKSNSGINPNVEAGQVWNVYFMQAQNALNTGANFKAVQISDHPNHVGSICNSGLGCSGNRNLLDFFTVDVDHLGAANVIWADDNNQLGRVRPKFSRQLSGNSVFANQNISLASSWPITDHRVTDRAGDVYDGAGLPRGSCAGMDILATSEQFSGNLLTVTMTLSGVPNKADAIACSTPDTPAIGGIWGAEFWAASATDGANNFYVAFRDADATQVEAGAVEPRNATLTSLEFLPRIVGTPGGACQPVSGGTPSSTCTVSRSCDTASPPLCTLTMTVDATLLGIKSGAGLYSISGVSTYFFGSSKPTLLNIEGGDSEQADAATAFDDNGTGTTK